MFDLSYFKIIYSKNLVFLVIIVVLINVFLLENFISEKDRSLFTSNDLYYINSINQNEGNEKNLKENLEKIQVNETSLLENVVEEDKINKIEYPKGINFGYYIILLTSLMSFILSFILYYNQIKNDFKIKDGFTDSIKTRLLEEYDLFD